MLSCMSVLYLVLVRLVVSAAYQVAAEVCAASLDARCSYTTPYQLPDSAIFIMCRNRLLMSWGLNFPG